LQRPAVEINRVWSWVINLYPLVKTAAISVRVVGFTTVRTDAAKRVNLADK
jgi:hypothetical protein